MTIATPTLPQTVEVTGLDDFDLDLRILVVKTDEASKVVLGTSHGGYSCYGTCTATGGNPCTHAQGCSVTCGC